MSRTHLAISIAGFQVQFTSFRNDSILYHKDVALTSADFSVVKEELDSFIAQNSFISENFDEISLSVATKQSSLVPNNVFAESSANDIYKLCFGECENDNSIDYNRISELSIVNVFSIQDWVIRYFVMKFPTILIQHEGSHSLRAILGSNAFYLKATVILHADFFQMTIVKHNQLEFYSFFDYQNHEDVLYHLLFALQQKEMTDEEGSIEFSQALGCKSEIIASIEKDFVKIKDLKQLKLSKPEHFIAKAQLLCV